MQKQRGTTQKLAKQLAKPRKIPQANGRGALLSGGLPGHKGAGGRPPDAIRATLRESFDKRIKLLEGFADDETLDPSVRMKAADMLAKYGMGTTITPTNTAGGDLPTSIPVELV